MQAPGPPPPPPPLPDSASLQFLTLWAGRSPTHLSQTCIPVIGHCARQQAMKMETDLIIHSVHSFISSFAHWW